MFYLYFSFSEFETMINPKVYKPPPKFSFRNLKKYMPQLKEMARKEGVSIDKEAEKAVGGKKPVKADTVLKFLKDDWLPQIPVRPSIKRSFTEMPKIEKYKLQWLLQCYILTPIHFRYLLMFPLMFSRKDIFPQNNPVKKQKVIRFIKRISTDTFSSLFTHCKCWPFSETCLCDSIKYIWLIENRNKPYKPCYTLYTGTRAMSRGRGTVDWSYEILLSLWKMFRERERVKELHLTTF